MLALLRQATQEFADEIGAPMTRARLSEDVTFAMLLALFLAWFAWQNHFEWMFAPLD